MTQQLNEQELALWQAKTSLEFAIEKCGRDATLDFLSPETRQLIFTGYVLQEHYNTLLDKYGICKMSSDLLRDIVAENCNAG